MSDVGRLLFGLRNAHDVDEALQKSAQLASVINAANEAELDEMKRTLAHVWQNSVMGLLALSLTPDYSGAARLALARLTDSGPCRH